MIGYQSKHFNSFPQNLEQMVCHDWQRICQYFVSLWLQSIDQSEHTFPLHLCLCFERQIERKENNWNMFPWLTFSLGHLKEYRSFGWNVVLYSILISHNIDVCTSVEKISSGTQGPNVLAMVLHIKESHGFSHFCRFSYFSFD